MRQLQRAVQLLTATADCLGALVTSVLQAAMQHAANVEVTERVAGIICPVINILTGKRSRVAPAPVPLASCHKHGSLTSIRSNKTYYKPGMHSRRAYVAFLAERACAAEGEKTTVDDDALMQPCFTRIRHLQYLDFQPRCCPTCTA